MIGQDGLLLPSSDLALTFTKSFFQFALIKEANLLPLSLVVHLNSDVPQHPDNRSWP